MPDDNAKRVQWEREARLLKEGYQAFREGQYIEDADLDAWLDGLAEDPDLPIPVANPAPKPHA